MSKRNQSAKAEEDYKKDDEREEKQSYDGPEWIVPNDKNGLKACFHCGMIKTKSQWQSAQYCENCGAFMDSQSSKKSNRIQGIMALINPKASFIRKKASIHPQPGKQLKGAAYGI